MLFVGFNPGFASCVSGHHYAGRNNVFWRLLEDSGLAPGLDASTDYRILEHDMGLTNVAPSPSGRSTMPYAEKLSYYQQLARLLR